MITLFLVILVGVGVWWVKGVTDTSILGYRHRMGPKWITNAREWVIKKTLENEDYCSPENEQNRRDAIERHVKAWEKYKKRKSK